MLGANTPIRLAQLALAASIGVALCYVIDSLPIPGLEHFGLAQASFGLAVFVVLFVGGITVSIIAQLRLESGLAAGRWTEAEREKAHHFIKHRTFRIVPWVFLVAYLGAMIWNFTKQHHHATLLVLTIWPTLTLGRLGKILETPKVTARPTRPPQPAPLYSEHWGR